VLIEAKDDGSGGDNWSYKLNKAPVNSSPPTNQHRMQATLFIRHQYIAKSTYDGVDGFQGIF